MTKAEILEELRKLTVDERKEILLSLDETDGPEWIDDDDPLSSEEKSLLEARLADTARHPEKSVPWEEARRRIGRFGK